MVQPIKPVIKNFTEDTFIQFNLKHISNTYRNLHKEGGDVLYELDAKYNYIHGSKERKFMLDYIYPLIMSIDEEKPLKEQIKLVNKIKELYKNDTTFYICYMAIIKSYLYNNLINDYNTYIEDIEDEEIKNYNVPNWVYLLFKFIHIYMHKLWNSRVVSIVRQGDISTTVTEKTVPIKEIKYPFNKDFSSMMHKLYWASGFFDYCLLEEMIKHDYEPVRCYRIIDLIYASKLVSQFYLSEKYGEYTFNTQHKIINAISRACMRSDLLRTRKLLTPKNGIILKTTEEDQDLESVYITELNSDEFYLFTVVTRLKDGSEYVNTVNLRDNSDYLYLNTPKADEVSKLITDFYKLDLSKYKVQGVDCPKYIVISPYYWRYRNKNYAKYYSEEDNSNLSDVTKEETDIFISHFCRKIKGNPSKEALTYAESVCITLKEGLTIVKPHNRTILKNIHLEDF